MTREQAGLIALCVAAGAYAAWTGPLLTLGCDSWHHIAQVERVLRVGGLLPRGLQGQVLPNSGVWYAVLAEVCRRAGVAPFTLWIALPAMVAPLVVLAAARLSRELLGPRYAVAGAAACLLLFEGSHLNPLRELGYPRYANLVLLFLALASAVRHVEEGRVLDLAAAAAAGALTAAVHLVEFALFGLLLGYFALALLVVSRTARLLRFRRAIAVGLATLALAAPYLHAVVFRELPDLVQNMQGGTPNFRAQRDVIPIADGLAVLDPTGEAGSIIGLAGVAAAALGWMLVPRARTHAGTALILGGLWGVPLTLFAPPVLPLFLRVWPTPEVLHRVALIMLVPWAVVALATRGRALAERGARVQAALAFLPLVLALPVACARLAEPARTRWIAEMTPVAGWRDLADFIAGRYREPAGLLTDPITGAYLAAFTGQYSVDTGTSNDPNADRRATSPAFQFFRDPCQTSADALAMLRASKVRLVVYNGRSAGDGYAAHALKDPYYGPETVPVLTANPAVFRPVFLAGAARVFEVDDEAAAVLVGKDASMARRRAALLVPAPAGAVPRDVGRGIDALVPPDGLVAHARRGAALDLALAFRFARDRDDYLKLRVHFLNPDYRGSGYRADFGKAYRKVVEALTGTLYRFGRDCDLVPEEYQVLPMSTGDVVAVRVGGPVPMNFAPGRYEIRVDVLSKDAPEPRRTLIEDDYPGIAVGWLVIE